MNLVVIIPALNEGEKVGRVVRGILTQKKSARVIVIDDGSSDMTREQAKKSGAIVLRHRKNRGLGAALGTGLRAARQLGADVVVTMDADGQHDAKDIDRLLKPIHTREADVVIGSRMKNPRNMPFFRRIMNIGSNLLTWFLFGIWTTDSQSGFRAFSKRAFSLLVIRGQKMEVSSEIFREIARLKLSFVEVPIRTIYTAYSLKKGQPLSNSFNVVWKLFVRAVQ